MSVTFDQENSTTSQTKIALIHDLLVGSEAEPTRAVTQGLTFCQAIFFFHSCGCRTTEPFFCCQPNAHSDPSNPLDGNPCQHPNPTVVVAKLPHSCASQIGDSEACAAEDSGAREFVREADTAERLDLVVLDECPRSDIDTVLPAKVEATFTVDNVVSRYRQERSRRKYNKVISATAAPFVPSLKARVTALPSPQTIGEVLEVAHDKPSGIRTDKEVVPIRDTVAIVEQDRLSYSEHRKESHQKDCLLIGEMVSREVTQILEPESDASENSDGFYAPELPVSTPTTTVNNEETNHEGSYDDLLTFWALDDDANEPNPRNTGYWGISSFLGRFGSRQG